MKMIRILLLCLLSLNVCGQIKKVGDIIENPDGSKGVVFWVSPDGKRGWMTALHDLPGVKPWGPMRDVPNLQNTGTTAYNVFYSAMADTAGYQNTRKLREYQGRGSIYAAQCVDFEHGWYIPAMGQIRKLYSVMFDINANLLAAGGSPFKTEGNYLHEYVYAASTEGDATMCWSCSFLTGQAGTVEKNVAVLVRPVRNFEITEMQYDTTLTYQWNTGEADPEILVTPQTTSNYQVTVTSAGGCENTAQQKIFVASTDPVILTDSICAGEVYRKNGFEVATEGEHTRLLLNDAGCHQLVILKLKVIEPKQTFFTADICEGEIYRENNFHEWRPGEHKQVWRTQNGCDSVVILTLSVHPSWHIELSDTICEGDVYQGYGFQATEQGDYEQPLQTVWGCDSLVTLHLTVRPAYREEIFDTICEGETYQEYGFVATETGDFYQSLPTVDGCDSLITLHLQVFPAYHQEYTDTICEGQIYSQYGFFASETGDYIRSVRTGSGCDSLTELHLTVHPSYYPVLTDTICKGDIYQGFGFYASEQGDYYQTLQTVHGCDSLIKLQLTVHPSYYPELFDTICEGDSYYRYGFEMPVGTPGDYTRLLKSVDGCDSIVSLHLAVTAVYHSVIYDTICEGEVYDRNGFVETTAGKYEKSLKAKGGCDSLVTLYLTVHPSYYLVIPDTICEGEVYNRNGFNTAEAGEHYRLLPTVYGCDSLVILQLMVNPSYHPVIFDTICEGEVYSYNGFSVSAPGTHQQVLQTVHGCDSVVTLQLTVRPSYHPELWDTICEGEIYQRYGFTAMASGDYTHFLHTVEGCDSVVTLHLTVHPVFDTLILDSVCAGDVYFRNGFAISEVGQGGEFPPLLYQSIHGCDSIVRLMLTVHPRYELLVKDTICYGEDYRKNGYELRAVKEGGYLPDHHWMTEKGCDSLVHCYLTLLPVYDKVLRDTVCEGAAYRKHGYNIAGAVVGQDAVPLKLQTMAGCDSTLYLFLKVWPTDQTYLEESVCAGERFSFHGTELTASGLYTDTLRNRWGCDSVLTLQFEVNPVYRDTIYAAVCAGERYRLNGFDEATAGLYARVSQSGKGCDSITYLALKVNEYFKGDMYVVPGDCGRNEYEFSVGGTADMPAGEIRCRWDFGDGQMSEEENPLHVYADTGYYTVTLQAEAPGNCVRTLDSVLYIPYYSKEVAIYASAEVIDSDDPTVLFRTDTLKNMRYEWDFGDGTGASGASVEHTYRFDRQQSFPVVLERINEAGCRAEAALVVEAYFIIAPPNTFSPNGDGRNDYFMRGYRIRITDRNGLEIFEGEDGWDGTRQGQPAPEDTYFYEVYYPSPEGMKLKQGYITLVR